MDQVTNKISIMVNGLGLEAVCGIIAKIAFTKSTGGDQETRDNYLSAAEYLISARDAARKIESERLSVRAARVITGGTL